MIAKAFENQEYLREFDQNNYFGDEPGAKFTDGGAEFTLWAPLALKAWVKIYDREDSPQEKLCAEMEKCGFGAWKSYVGGCVSGQYYTYVIDNGENGGTNETIDLYAKACGANGKRGMLLDLRKTDPEGFESCGYVNCESIADAVLYEAHVRDFSIDPSSGVSEKDRGKFSGFAAPKTSNSKGLGTCLSHLKELGVTHVHLLPVFDFASVDELNPTEYNWGYDPLNYNIPEGSYSSDPHDGAARIKELKSLIAALHANSIGVVMDVVYNHTYFGLESAFNKTVPMYYYRSLGGKLTNGSGCGNELASERKMCRNYIVDSVLYWAKEYKIDGFRFDLMGCLDIETMSEISSRLKEINPSAIIYGEGWTGGKSALSDEKAARKSSSGKLCDIAFFNDVLRDGIKGSTFKSSVKGYAGGNIQLAPVIADSLRGRADFSKNPSQLINYCEAHDNYTLWDKIALSCPEMSRHDRRKAARLSAAIVMLSQGVPFIQAGQEFLRSKPLSGGGFDFNSYKSPDSVNSIKWDEKSENEDIFNYYKGLIEFRRAHRLLRLRTQEECDGCVYVSETKDGEIFAHLHGFDEEIIIILNPTVKIQEFKLPDGEWHLCVSDIQAGTKPLATLCDRTFAPPISAIAMVKAKE